LLPARPWQIATPAPSCSPGGAVSFASPTRSRRPRRARCSSSATLPCDPASACSRSAAGPAGPPRSPRRGAPRAPRPPTPPQRAPTGAPAHARRGDRSPRGGGGGSPLFGSTPPQMPTPPGHARRDATAAADNGGADGWELLNRVIAGAPRYLVPGGRLIFTIFAFLGPKAALAKLEAAGLPATPSRSAAPRIPRHRHQRLRHLPSPQLLHA